MTPDHQQPFASNPRAITVTVNARQTARAARLAIRIDQVMRRGLFARLPAVEKAAYLERIDGKLDELSRAVRDALEQFNATQRSKVSNQRPGHAGAVRGLPGAAEARPEAAPAVETTRRPIRPQIIQPAVA